MAHDDALHMAHVLPGCQGDMVWNFKRAGQFDFACLIPGHYQAGMTGSITVLASGH
ncbi:plastocyanin/azurin family copper-binding protein [Simplicispira psychrophila]|uniref:plastocyanin/azurin family copper-binding protein n=1 Tax=Simplicispira psychrophila TaxID=80882 RepID=UPI00316AD166